MLGDATGLSERTWRNRLHSKWNPAPEDIEKLKGKQLSAFVARQEKHGYSEQESNDIFCGSPSWQAGAFLPTADIIYWCAPTRAEDYSNSIGLASVLDHLSNAYFVAKEAGNFEQARHVVMEVGKWTLSQCPPGSDLQTLDDHLATLESASEIEGLLKAAKEFAGEGMLLCLSCWDLEFCSAFTAGKAKAYPLFELVMPRLDPSIEIDPNTGQLFRNGKTAKRKQFQKPISRLIDFIAVLAARRRSGQKPASIPSVREMSAWFDVDESKIVSWRDETTKFTERDFFRVWKSAIPVDEKGERPADPLPMLVAALIWSPLLTRDESKTVSLIDPREDYESWWMRNHARLTAKGLPFGNTPWPECLTSQSSGS